MRSSEDPVRILIVDDSSERLGDLGEETVRARSSEEALRHLRDDRIAVAFLNARLPGLEVFKEAPFPLVFFSDPAPSPEETARAYGLGAVDVVALPADLRSRAAGYAALRRRTRSLSESIAELAPVGVFHTDAAGDCIWVNRRWSEISGVPRDQALGKGWSKAIHPEDRERVFGEWYRAARQGLPFRAEYRFLRPDGLSTWVLGQAKAESDPSGRATGHVGTVTDITERKRAEDELERRVLDRTAELRILSDVVPALISHVGKDERYIHVNKAYEVWFGRRSAEIEGLHFRDVLGEEAYQVIRPYVREALSGREVTFEAEIPYRNGLRFVRVTYVPLRDGAGEISGFVVLVNDLSEQRRADRNSAQLAAIVRSSEDAIITKTLEGTITSWNAGAERVFGYPADEAVGRPIMMLVPEERLGEERAILEKLSRGERIISYETVRLRKDGTRIDVSLTVSPMRDRDERVIGASTIARDITERVRAQEAIRELNETLEARVQARTAELARALEELNTFSYTVAHDLRAPLRSMHRYADVLLLDYAPALDEEARGFLGRIAAAATRMDHLIRDLLAYSRIVRLETRIGEIPVEEALDDALGQLSGEIEARRAEIEVVRPLPSARADRVLLAQALANLVSNAIKFVPAGAVPRVRIRAELRDAATRVWIEDNGIGVDPKYRDRLFRMFERLHGPDVFPGTGIGLAIVKRSVERMSGTVGFEPGVPNGTRFWVEVPSGGRHD